jgi:aspartyl-tRNA(Asn)/glutamyl-tRNA(Gln) amidotransferase subunit A
MSGALHDLSINQAGALLRKREISSRQLTEHALARIGAIDPRVNAFITLTPERALADADAADAAFKRGDDAGPMQGIPYALKDIFDTAGIRTTCHSKLREHNVPTADSAVAEKFRASGGALLGKLSTHEFALGGPSFDLPFPPARNPWNTDHIPGGSSSGSGAAVAAGLVRMAMGSDTGGSIRGPASYCGTIGLKPTFGLVSRRGVFPLAYSLDHCGPLAWTIEDAAIAMEIIAGYDPLDPASLDVPIPDFRGSLTKGVKGLKIGIVGHFHHGAAGLSPEVATAIDAAAKTLADLGAIVEDAVLPNHELFNACGRVIMFSEAYAIHERDFQTRPRDFGLFTWLRMTLGAFVTATDIIQAHRLRRELALAVNRSLKTYDVLISAGALAPAPRFDSSPPGLPANAPLLNSPANVTGNPALSIPIGFSSDGLPLGMQMLGRYFDEPMILRVGAAIEAATQLTQRRPALAG